MRIDVSKLRHLGAPPPASSAPPGTPRASRLFHSRWLLIVSLIALFLTASASARFQTLSASAAPVDSVVADMTGDTSAQNEIAAGPEAQNPDAATTDESASEDPVTVGRDLGGYTTTSRGGTRPAASMGSQLASVARQYEGAPYRWAGASPAGFDCSGFTMYVYSKVGISIPRDHWGQLNTGTQLGMDDLQPGDIVFFQNTYERGLSHSGIYLGDNQFIHAETEWTGVVISRLRGSQWERGFVAGSRPYQ